MPNPNQNDIAEKLFAIIEAAVSASPYSLACGYEYLPTENDALPCLSMQSVAGAPVEMGFTDGSYIATYRLSLTLRQNAPDHQARLDARKILLFFAEDLINKPLDLGSAFTLLARSMDSLPTRIQAEESFFDYQVTFSLKYKAQQ